MIIASHNQKPNQVDSYALHAASAIAGVVSFRALAGFGFPLLAGGWKPFKLTKNIDWGFPGVYQIKYMGILEMVK